MKKYSGMAEYKFIRTDYIEMVSGGDAELKRELISIFREQVAEFYEEMKSLLSDKKYASLGQLAHKAKSSVAIMGMDELAEMLKTLELKAVNGIDSDDYGSIVERFGSDTKSALIELESLINKL